MSHTLLLFKDYVTTTYPLCLYSSRQCITEPLPRHIFFQPVCGKRAPKNLHVWDLPPNAWADHLHATWDILPSSHICSFRFFLNPILYDLSHPGRILYDLYDHESNSLWPTWYQIWSFRTYLILDLLYYGISDSRSDPLYLTWSWSEPLWPIWSQIWSTITYLIPDLILWPTWSQIWCSMTYLISHLTHYKHVSPCGVSKPSQRHLLLPAHLLRGTVLHLELEIARSPLGGQP